MTTCVFGFTNNILTTISGADAGSYTIKDNSANILISAVTYTVNPFDTNKVLGFTNNVLTIEIT